ncbi:hypothetical protein L6R53_00305 [Myxococcota bacterium]|nr:hypothetical protein [Myxococcota bacterium]
MTMIASLVLMVACGEVPDPETPAQVPPKQDPPPAERSPTDELTMAAAAALPIGDGPTEFRVEDDLVGLGFRIDGGEHIYMFQAAVPAGTNEAEADWDAATDSIQTWPSGCSPDQLTLTPALCTVAVPLKVFAADGSSTVCTTANQGTDGCPRLMADHFLDDLKVNIGHRIKRDSFNYPDISHASATVPGGTSWSAETLTDCKDKKGATDTTRNDAYHIGEDRVWQHMLVSGNIRIAKVVHFAANLQPGPSERLTHVLNWPSEVAPSPELTPWCDQVDAWCKNAGGSARPCYYAELTFTYP